MDKDDTADEFDVNEWMTEGEEGDLDWDFTLDDEGGLIDNQTLPLRYKLLAVILALLVFLGKFVVTVLVLFVLIVCLVFLMNLTGVAFPVS